MVYIVEILASIDDDMPLQWRKKNDERIVGEVAQGKGIKRKMSMVLRKKITKSCILNNNEMQK